MNTAVHLIDEYLKGAVRNMNLKKGIKYKLSNNFLS